jgi:hypothetical protein
MEIGGFDLLNKFVRSSDSSVALEILALFKKHLIQEEV